MPGRFDLDHALEKTNAWPVPPISVRIFLTLKSSYAFESLCYENATELTGSPGGVPSWAIGDLHVVHQQVQMFPSHVPDTPLDPGFLS